MFIFSKTSQLYFTNLKYLLQIYSAQKKTIDDDDDDDDDDDGRMISFYLYFFPIFTRNEI